MSSSQSEFVYWQNIYEHEIDLLCFNLSVNHKYFEIDYFIKSDNEYIVYRNVKHFVRHVIAKKNTNARLVAIYYLRDFAFEWFNNLFESIQDDLTKNLEYFCIRLIELFDSTKQSRRTELQQQVENARLAKKRQKVEKARIIKQRTKIFACKRCFAKYSNNTKLHQHIQNYH